MILLKVLVTGLFTVFAVLAGLFVAAVSVLAVVLRRWLGRKAASRPSQPEPGMASLRRQPRTESPHDVIDITATEVPADSIRR